MINFPSTRKEVENRAKADVKSQLTTSNPWLKNSFLGALITGYAGRVYEFYLQLKNALLEMFPDTASGSYLERWGSYVSVTRAPATKASGYVVFTGTTATVIPVLTVLTESTGNTYQTTAEAVTTTNIHNVSSITRSGSVATVTTTGDHQLASGVEVTIAGAVETDYNGIYEIVVTSATTFTYTVDNSPTSPATGTITATISSAYVHVESVGYGSVLNQVSGTPLTLSTPISGIDSSVFVAFDEVGNGSDVESDEAFRSRVLYRYQNPIALFNETAIKIKAYERTGVSRVWVFQPGDETNAISVTSITRTGSVATVVTATNHSLEDGQVVTISGATLAGYNLVAKVLVINDTTFAYIVDSSLTSPATGTKLATPGIPNGQVKIYFTRDEDTNPIPTPAEVTIVKDKILEIKPAHVATKDVLVNAPVAVPIDFTFTAITPNTSAMMTAITDSLTALFKYETNVGEDLQLAAYTAAIWQTVDSSGALVKSFTLSTPTATQTINEGQIATLGTVTFT